MVEVLPFPDFSPENITEQYGDGSRYELSGQYASTERPALQIVSTQPYAPEKSSVELPITNLEMVQYANNISDRLDLLRREASEPQPVEKKRSRFGRGAKPLHILTEREIIQRESEQGAKLLEKPAKGERAEFFYLGGGAWIWHKEKKDASGKIEIQTTRYEVKDDAVIKAQDGEKRSFVGDAQLHNLALWMFNYYELVARNVYSREPGTHARLEDEQAA